MLSRLAFDSLAALALGLTALLGAYTPAYLAKRDRIKGGSGRSMTYVLGNMLSAGVMVSAGFCHLLGEALKQMPHMQFPLATFLCGVGFLFTLVADKIAARSASWGHHGGGCGHHHHQGMPAKSPGTDSCCAVEVLAGMDIAERGVRHDKHSDSSEGLEEAQGLLHECTPSPGARRGGAAAGTRSNGGLAGRQQPAGGGGGGTTGGVLANGGSSSSGGGGAGGSILLEEVLHDADSGRLSPQHSLGLGGGGSGSGSGPGGGGGGSSSAHHRAGGQHASQQLAQHAQQQVLHRDSSGSLVFEVEPPPQHALGGPSGGGGSGGLLAAASATARSVSFLTAVLMGVALCFHSLLEGAAMGAQQTISNSLHIFIAIVSHKGLAAYALGSSVVDAQVSMRSFWSVVLPFTLASPVGIFVGYVISDIAKGVGAASISALASGTFLYVAFMEVIPKEVRDPSHMASKLIMLLLGFVLMSVLAIWA